MSPVVSAPQGFTTRRGLSVSDWDVCFGLGCLGGIWFLGVLTIAASGEGKRGD